MNLTNPFTQDIAGTVARTLIAALAGSFALSNDEVQRYSGALAVLLVGAWSGYQKFRARQKLVTAAASPGVMTEVQIENKIAEGQAPSVTTPAVTVPKLATPSASR